MGTPSRIFSCTVALTNGIDKNGLIRMKIGYARVSTREQSLSLQVDALKKAGFDHIHEEIASGTKTSRPVLEEIMRNLEFTQL